MRRNPILSDNNSRMPVKRKRKKEELQKKNDSAKKIELAAEFVAAQVERNVALKKNYEIVIFTSAPAACYPSESVEYFRIMRACALAYIRK